MNKHTHQLHEQGLSLWLDNITRGLLRSGTLDKYIHELSISGLTSNPTIFDHAIRNTDFYDDAIRQKANAGLPVEKLFFELAIEDLSQTASLFKPAWMAGFRSKSRPSWPTTRRAPCRPPGSFTIWLGCPTCSSRSPARSRACRRSKKLSSPGCRST